MTNKKHIAHMVYSLDIGGLERVMINCINGLPEYKHSIIVLTTYSDQFANLLNENISIIPLDKPDGHDWSIYRKIYKTLKVLNADILHTYNLATLEYQVIGFFAGVSKRIHAEHGRDVFDPDGSNKKYQWLRRLVSPFVQTFVSVSEDLHLWMQNTVKISVNKTKLIYNGVNTQTYSPSNQKSLLTPSQENKFVFGTVGRLAEIKDHRLMIKGFQYACSQNEDFKRSCRLSIVGDGGEREKLSALIQEVDMQEHIWLAGARHDMPNVYASLDCFVLSSKAEGVPMTILEAMASGLPVLSTSVGGVPEVVEEGITGWLVLSHDEKEFGQRMIEAYNVGNAFNATARQHACDKFSENAMLNAYQKEYQRGM